MQNRLNKYCYTDKARRIVYGGTRRFVQIHFILIEIMKMQAVILIELNDYIVGLHTNFIF